MRHGRWEMAMSDTSFEYDESEWPIVRIQTPGGAVDDVEFERNFQRLTAYLERRQQLVFVIELHTGTNLTVKQRDEIRRHEERQRALITQFQRGIAIVAHSKFQRAMINAIFWLIRSPSPTQAFSDVESAKVWARSLLGQRSLSSPASSTV
jgi:hypothetical protein